VGGVARVLNQDAENVQDQREYCAAMVAVASEVNIDFGLSSKADCSIVKKTNCFPFLNAFYMCCENTQDRFHGLSGSTVQLVVLPIRAAKAVLLTIALSVQKSFISRI